MHLSGLLVVAPDGHPLSAAALAYGGGASDFVADEFEVFLTPRNIEAAGRLRRARADLATFPHAGRFSCRRDGSGTFDLRHFNTEEERGPLRATEEESYAF
jgi:hypothetical protein